MALSPISRSWLEWRSTKMGASRRAWELPSRITTATDGWIFLRLTSDDTPTLYRNDGEGVFSDVTYAAGLGLHTQYLGWGTMFFDFDNDGWPDLILANGHVYLRWTYSTWAAGTWSHASFIITTATELSRTCQ